MKSILVSKIRRDSESRIKIMLDDIAGEPENVRRKCALAGIVSSIPKKVLKRSNVNVSGSDRWFDVTITPKAEEFSEHDTLLITAWCAGMDKWTFEKQANSYDGSWNHSIERKRGNWRMPHYTVTFMGTSEIDGCVLEEVIETREVKSFKVKC